jgi:hypothetical protein
MARISAATSFRSAMAPALYQACLRAFAFLIGAPGDVVLVPICGTLMSRIVAGFRDVTTPSALVVHRFLHPKPPRISFDEPDNPVVG